MTSEPAPDHLADVIAGHTWVPSSHWSEPHKCSCGRRYDNPNASQFHTHARHVADAVRAHLLARLP